MSVEVPAAVKPQAGQCDWWTSASSEPSLKAFAARLLDLSNLRSALCLSTTPAHGCSTNCARRLTDDQLVGRERVCVPSVPEPGHGFGQECYLAADHQPGEHASAAISVNAKRNTRSFAKPHQSRASGTAFLRPRVLVARHDLGKRPDHQPLARRIEDGGADH
jgi:hypothetical protein